MEDQAPYHAAASQPAAARNLAAPLATWLRQMGFAVSEHGGAEPTALTAKWTSPDGLLFQVLYAFGPQQGGIFQLLGHSAEVRMLYHGLVHAAQVKRLKEARYLLLSNVYYAEARRAALASGALQPTALTVQPTSA